MTGAVRPSDGTAPETQSAASRFLATAAWAVALVVIALIAVSALANTGDQISTLARRYVRTRPAPLAGRDRRVPAGRALRSIALARRAALRDRLRGAALPLLIVGLAVGVRVVLAVIADAALRDETAIIHEQALGVLDGDCCFSHRPLGYPIVLAGAYALFGVGPSTIEALNICFAAVTTLLVWEIGRVALGPAGGGGGGHGLCARAVTGPHVARSAHRADVHHARGRHVRAGIVLERRPMLVAAAACARSSPSASTCAPRRSRCLSRSRSFRRSSAGRCGARSGAPRSSAASSSSSCCPWSRTTCRSHGDVSLSTSAYGGWSLYVGANREHLRPMERGGCGPPGGFPGDSWWDRSEYAGRPGRGSRPRGSRRLARHAARQVRHRLGQRDLRRLVRLAGRVDHSARSTPAGWRASSSGRRSSSWPPFGIYAATARPATGRPPDRNDHHAGCAGSPGARGPQSLSRVPRAPVLPAGGRRRRGARCGGGMSVAPRSLRAEGRTEVPRRGYCGGRLTWRNCAHANCCHR